MDLYKGMARFRALVACLAFLGFGFTSATAQTPDSTKGVAWLAAQVQNDGSLANEASSIATPFQGREETLLTLCKLATAPAALASAIAANADDDTEYVARRALAAAAAGQASISDVAALLARQNADGGWGLTPGYQSDALDTAIALQALSAANASSAVAANGFAYLSLARLSDAGWGVNQSSAYVTANVLFAAGLWPSQGTTIASTAATWLLGARNAGQEYGDSFDNALALLSLSAQANQGAALSPLISALGATQLADGSWADDPYVTAVALRAVWYADQPPVTSSTGDVIGVVVDQAGSQPVAGASIRLAENAGISVTTAADGTFHLSSVPAATYTLQVSRSGYQSRTASISVSAGQTLNIGSIALSAISTTVTLSGLVKNNTGQLLQDVIVAVGTKSTLTDASGAYQILGINPGSATVTATLSGYKTVSATVAFQASTNYLFSPTMYPTSVTPPTTSLQGVVVSGNTNAPIVGANVVLSAVTHTTDATGKFAFSPVTAGAYLMTVSASGFQTVTAAVSVVVGVNDVGIITLQPIPSTTTLQGTVTGGQGDAVVNAIIAVDSGPSTTSDTTGTYQLSGLIGTQFTVHVSAAGYVAQTFAVTFSTPGDYTQDFHLVAQQTTSVTLGPITVAPMSAGANTNLSVSTTLVNGGDAPFEGTLLLEVRDATDAVVGSAVLTSTAGFSIGSVVLQPGENLGVLGRWNTGQFAPGAYKFEMRLVVPNTPSRSNPLGTLILNQFAPFSITPTSHFSGTVAGDPPVLQAGLNQAVDFTGVIKNDGNVTLPAQTMKLTVSDAKTGAIAFIGGASIADLASSELANVDLGSWVPTTGGNYQLTITAIDPTLGSISGSLYVGNVAQATFTVNPDTVLAGTRAVHGNIHVTGVDPTQATITDPLAPLIRTAIQKAVTYNDGTAHQWIDTNKCSSCHIGTQALIGGELTRSLTTFNALDRATIINDIATNQATNGGITAGYNDTSAYWPRLGTMALWGLLGYHDPVELQTVYKRAA
ncbi:MAG TPA: carboxypeptidase regulatory-like domain-containing protein, partial [Rudaea sp.]